MCSSKSLSKKFNTSRLSWAKSIIHQVNFMFMSIEYKGYEWVQPEASGRRGGYWRRIPRTRLFPTGSQARFRLHFSKIASLTRGLTGTKKLPDGREVSKSALLIGALLKRSNTEENTHIKLASLPLIHPSSLRFYTSSTITL